MSMLCFNPLFLIMGSSVPLLQLREIFYSLAYTLGTLSEVAYDLTNADVIEL